MTLKVKIQVDTQVVTKELSKAMRSYSKELDQKLDHQFFNSTWEWAVDFATGSYRETRRRNGQTVTSPRNIIDTGELLNSKQGPKPIGGGRIGRRWVWTAPYARYVKDGYMTTKGNIVPPRDWIRAALRELPFGPSIYQRLRK